MHAYADGSKASEGHLVIGPTINGQANTRAVGILSCLFEPSDGSGESAPDCIMQKLLCVIDKDGQMLCTVQSGGVDYACCAYLSHIE